MSIRKTVPISEADWNIEPRPLWVETREPDWQFVPEEGYPVAFLLMDEQHHITSKAVYQHTFRRIITHSALQSLGQVELDFDPAGHRLRIHNLSIWRQVTLGNWQQRSVTNRDAFLIRQREQQLEQQILNGRATVVTLLEDLRVDDVIELAWTLESRDPMPGLKFTAFYAFACSYPVARVSYSLHLDPEEPVSWRMHTQGKMPEPLVEQWENQIKWSQIKPSIFVPEPNAPGDQWPFPMLEVSGWKAWADVADFIATAWEDALKEGAQLTAIEVAQLEVVGDLSASVCAAVRFVQENIRYLVVDFGHGGGILPNGAGTVLRRRFGDCKDKTVLLTSMLRALGLEAYPLLVAPNWCHAIARVQPSTATFSHAVVTFMLEGNRYTVDPTLIGQGGDLARMIPPAYGYGLEVRKGASDLLPLAMLPPAELLLKEVFHLDRTHPAEGRVEQQLSATSWLANDLRASLISGGHAAFFKSRAEMLQKHFPALLPDTESPRVEDNLSNNSIELHTRHGLPTWGSARDSPPPKFTYAAYGLLLAVESLGGPEKRAQPWALRHPMTVRHLVIVKGRDVQKAQTEKHRFSGPGFTYSCDVTATRHEVTFDYCWKTTESRIPAKDWPKYCEERGKAFDRAGANVATPSSWQNKKFTSPRSLISITFLVMVMASAISQMFSRFGSTQANETTAELDDATLQMKLAVEAMNRGDYNTTAPIIEKLRPYYSQSMDYHLMRAETAVYTNYFDRAKESLTTARELEPTNQSIDIIQALLYEKMGDLTSARKVLDQVLLCAPNDTGALLSQARITERLGDTTAALDALKKLLALRPEDADGLSNYALLIWKTGDHRRANEVILKAIQAQSTPSPLLEAALSNYYSATHRITEAADAAQRAAQLAPTNPCMAYRNTMAQARAGNKAIAIDLARAMTKQFPNQTLAWHALAVISATTDDPTTAEYAFQKWLEFAPKDSEAHSSYGFFKYQLGNVSEARSILEKASHDFPGNGLIWMNYSAVLASQGEAKAAKLAREKANALMSEDTLMGLMR
jgi:Tfp pilus assembly protein PilF